MKAVLLEGSLDRWIWRLSWPMLIGFISLSSVPLADVIFISPLGSFQQAMISLILPMTLVAMGIPVGLNIALSSLLARYLGHGDREKIGPLFTFAALAMALFSVFIAFLVTVSDTFLYQLLGAKDEISLDLLKSYFIPWIWGWCPLSVVVTMNAIFRAQGRTRSISAIMIFAALSHVLADILLIKGVGSFEGLGMPGAGWAEVISGILSLVFSFYWQKKEGTLRYWQWDMPYKKEIRALSKLTFKQVSCKK